MPIRGLPVFLPAALAAACLFAQGASAQTAAAPVPATNDVASCTLIADPTAQRLCIQSAQQSRPASTFDPTAQKQKQERRGPARRDAMSVGGKPAPTDKATANQGVKPGATPEEERAKNWRLQIP